MKVKYKAMHGKLEFELEGDEQVALFSQLAEIQDIFDEGTCGLCGKDDIKFVQRLNKDGDTFYELKCVACKAKLDMHQHREKTKKGGLYISRRDKEGKPLKNGGWYRWTPNGESSATEPELAKPTKTPVKEPKKKPPEEVDGKVPF